MYSTYFDLILFGQKHKGSEETDVYSDCSFKSTHKGSRNSITCTDNIFQMWTLGLFVEQGPN